MIDGRRAQLTTPPPVRKLVIALVLLGILVVVGVEVHNEMIPALEQCAPNCDLRG